MMYRFKDSKVLGKNYNLRAGNGSVKHTSCSCRLSILSINPVPGDRKPFSGLLGHCHNMGILTCRQNTQKIKIEEMFDLFNFYSQHITAIEELELKFLVGTMNSI